MVDCESFVNGIFHSLHLRYSLQHESNKTHAHSFNSLNLNCLKLLLWFEKIHNRFCKYLLGVHKKASNFVSKCKLGRLPIISFITSLAFKYYSRLHQLLPTFVQLRLLHEVFEVDRGLFQEGHKSWLSFIDSSAN